MTSSWSHDHISWCNHSALNANGDEAKIYQKSNVTNPVAYFTEECNSSLAFKNTTVIQWRFSEKLVGSFGEIGHETLIVTKRKSNKGSLLRTWINFNPSMDKYSHTP